MNNADNKQKGLEQILDDFKRIGSLRNESRYEWRWEWGIATEVHESKSFEIREYHAKLFTDIVVWHFCNKYPEEWKQEQIYCKKEKSKLYNIKETGRADLIIVRKNTGSLKPTIQAVIECKNYLQDDFKDRAPQLENLLEDYCRLAGGIHENEEYGIAEDIEYYLMVNKIESWIAIKDLIDDELTGRGINDRNNVIVMALDSEKFHFKVVNEA